MAAAPDIESFMEGALVTWLKSCLETQKCIVNYEDLVDGLILHEVVHLINPEPEHDGVVPSMGNASIRIRNLDVIIKNIKAVYEEELCQTLLMVPDCVEIGRHPESKLGLENMQLLLLLLLGCAVQCPNKERFIYHIKQLSLDVQHDIVDCIKQVTDSQKLVLSHDTSDANVQPELLMAHVRRLVKERDRYLQQWLGASIQDRMDATNLVGSPAMTRDSQRRQSSQVAGNESHHLAVELADWKARLRKQRQELEEKSEALAECKEEMELYKIQVSKLRTEVQELMQDARSAKMYRDELDAVRERAERVEKLETEVQRYREKLSDIDFFRTRVEELREDNRVLMETREMLEEQLQKSRKRSEHVLELESELIKYKQQINDVALDHEATQEKLQEAYEENTRLQLLAKTKIAENSALDENKVLDETAEGSTDNSLSEQLSSNAQARALRLELENRRLQSAIDSLKESSFLENSNKILELEKEKKKLSIKVEQLQDNTNQLQLQNAELEQLVKDALQENRKLQESREASRIRSDKLDQELQAEQNRREEAERASDNLNKEKNWLQAAHDSLQRKVEELERSNESASQQAERNRTELQKIPELERRSAEAESKCETLEREVQNSSREISKLREALEEKHVAFDEQVTEVESLQKEVSKLTKQLEEAKTTVTRLQEVERESQELASQAAAEREALFTLQSDLIAEKTCIRQLKGGLEKLGLSMEQLMDPDTILESIMSSAEVQRASRDFLKKEFIDSPLVSADFHETIVRTSSATETKTEEVESERLERVSRQCEELRSEISALQTAADVAHSENTRLQVQITTLESRISSLTTQHTALQVANTQLVAEKDELLKERSAQQQAQEQLLLDQVTLQSLHEQLTVDYEALIHERDTLRTSQRDLRSELRALKDRLSILEQQHHAHQTEKDALLDDSRSLANLRAEHSKLKEDFRHLFTASTELRGIQEEYRLVRSENAAFRLRQTELEGKFADQAHQINFLELEVSKLRSKCEMLLQMNTGLEEDRRSLMEHVSQLLSQYQELLNHSLEDKEQYHLEEKMFTDKLNNLHRQKEKLEEKIMEHYRRMESCSTKKRGFSASFVKMKKKASDLINKGRRSWHDDSRGTEVAQSPSRQGSDSGDNDSDSSSEDVNASNVKSGGFAQSSLSLGSAGTRRTVYYTEQDNEDDAPRPTEFNNDQDDNESKVTLDAKNSSNSSEPRLLVYNRISTVIGDSPGASQWNASSPTLPLRHSSQSKQDDCGKRERGSTLPSGSTNKGPKGRENSIWYEYGCV